jgi:uncharacterized membrane protein YeaQ/YmgE (transglycosylase-associated protein family)
MGIISWIVLGLIAGFIGSKIVDSQGQGFWLNIALGIVGALVGGFLFDVWGVGRYRAEYLQHDRRHRWIDRCAVDLQRADRSSPSLMQRRGMSINPI